MEISVGDEVLYKAFIHGLRYPEQGVLKGSEKRVYYRLLGELVDLCRREGQHPAGTDHGGGGRGAGDAAPRDAV